MPTIHNSLKKRLSQEQGKKMTSSLYRSIYPSAKMHFEYYRKDEVVLPGNGLQIQKTGYRKPDSILVVNPLAKNHRGETFTIAIEVKVRKESFNEDNKYPKYLGWTDFLLIAVPAKISAYVNSRITNPYIGVVDIDTGDIVRMPMRQAIPPERELFVIRKMMFRFRTSHKRTEVCPE